MPIPNSKFKRRLFLSAAGLGLTGAGFIAGRSTLSKAMLFPTGVDEAELAEMRLPLPVDPEEALERLVNGNAFFVAAR